MLSDWIINLYCKLLRKLDLEVGSQDSRGKTLLYPYKSQQSAVKLRTNCANLSALSITAEALALAAIS